MFFYIFLSPTAGVSRTDKLGMVLEARRVCLAAMGITLEECEDRTSVDLNHTNHTLTNSTQLFSSSLARQAWNSFMSLKMSV